MFCCKTIYKKNEIILRETLKKQEGKEKAAHKTQAFNSSVKDSAFIFHHISRCMQTYMKVSNYYNQSEGQVIVQTCMQLDINKT